MKAKRNVLRYILSCVLIPGVTWGSGSVAAADAETPQQLGGAVIDWIDGLIPNVVYHTKTYDIQETSDMEKGLDMKVNATFKLHTDITVNEDSLYDGWLETGWNKASGRRGARLRRAEQQSRYLSGGGELGKRQPGVG